MHVHHEVIKRVLPLMPDENCLIKLSDLFKVFGDLTRIRILSALSNEEMCVGCIVELLEMNQSAVSHQLRVLKEANLVDYRRDGKQNVYFLADDHVKTMIAQGFEHINEGE